MRGATGINLQPHQILRLPREIALPNLREIYWKQLKWHFQCATDPSMIRERSENDPTLKTQNWTRRAAKATSRTRQEQILLKITTFSRSGYHSKFHQMLHLPQKVTHELHQMLHLPQKVTHELHQMLHLSQKVTHELHQMLHLPQKVTHELHQMLHLPQKVTHELHQMLHLPRKVTVMIDLHHIWNVIYNARSNRHQPPTSPNTAPATRNCTPKS